MHRCKQKQPKILQNRTCWPQVQIRPASKAYSTSSTLFLSFVQQTCQNIARITEIISTGISLVHGWAIKQDNRILQQYKTIKITEKLL